MAKKRKTKRQPPDGDALAAYRRIRKPMPPPGRVFEDRRRRAAERDAERQVREPWREERGEEPPG
jgi:hypothetical protein